MSNRVPSTLVPLYREEIYTHYLVLRCLATKKVCGLAATSPSLELFEGKKKISGPFFLARFALKLAGLVFPLTWSCGGVGCIYLSVRVVYPTRVLRCFALMKDVSFNYFRRPGCNFRRISEFLSSPIRKQACRRYLNAAEACGKCGCLSPHVFRFICHVFT